MFAEYMLTIIFTVIITWIIARHYYKRANEDQVKLFNKLPEQIIGPILNDRRQKITVKELNMLLTEKTIDKESKYPLPFKACPECGSKDIERGSDGIIDVERGDDDRPVVSRTPYTTIKCNKCGWCTDEIREFSHN